MKTLFIPAKSKYKLNKDKIKSLKLPKNTVIAYSIQFKDMAIEINKILKTKIIQVLGCSKPKLPKNTKAILLIGSGKFHASSLAIETRKPIYILEKDKLTKISEKEIQNFKNKQRGAYLKFLNSKKIGILISTKPGQQRLKQALNLKIKNKTKYFFLANEITNEFENFEIESWINTACPRLDMNNPIINIDKVK